MQCVNCNLCQADNYQLIWQENKFSLAVCRNCGLVYLNPRLAQEETRLFYEGYLPRYPDDYLLSPENAFTRTAEERSRFLEKYIHPDKTRILEIGCGYGHFLHLLQQRGGDVYGIEPSRESVNFAVNKFALKNVYNATIEEVDSLDHEFDVIALFHVLEHVPDPAAVLGKIRELLADDGLLFIDVPDIHELPITLIEYFELYTNQHLYGFSAASLGEMLRKNGFVPDYIRNRPLAVNSFSSNLRVIARKGAVSRNPISNDYNNTINKLKVFISGMQGLRQQLNFRVEQWERQKKRIIIYGAGYHTLTLFEFADFSKCNIVGIIDDDEQKWGQILDEYRVYPPEKILYLDPEVVLISSLGAEDRIYERIKILEKAGIDVIKIYG